MQKESLCGVERISELELANYWGIKTTTLQKWRSIGVGPTYIKIGGKVVYPIEAIKEYENGRMFQGSGKRIDANKWGENEK